jgi:ribosomal protein S27E
MGQTFRQNLLPLRMRCKECGHQQTIRLAPMTGDRLIGVLRGLRCFQCGGDQLVHPYSPIVVRAVAE